jgi:hypothetical protein
MNGNKALTVKRNPDSIPYFDVFKQVLMALLMPASFGYLLFSVNEHYDTLKYNDTLKPILWFILIMLGSLIYDSCKTIIKMPNKQFLSFNKAIVLIIIYTCIFCISAFCIPYLFTGDTLSQFTAIILFFVCVVAPFKAMKNIDKSFDIALKDPMDELVEQKVKEAIHEHVKKGCIKKT